jgi:hypothetical protein
MSGVKSDYIFYSVLSFIGYIVVIGTIYLLDNYIGFLLNLIFLAMILVLLIISIIAEKLERTKISPLYFYSMSSLLIASVILGVLLKLTI